ncbi:MAG: hypothetical protein RMX68_019795 [Aulosira sp. ZfuVER01]|nr:hypothetical protein [Aulosira sp. ZfuVER01]MDZ7996376.1 hypothetical protein [Aulosira sp. DedVER01a]MDZ8054064.1 hypothetical protein [Aulosira sp. ZfuCHP01]
MPHAQKLHPKSGWSFSCLASAIAFTRTRIIVTSVPQSKLAFDA